MAAASRAEERCVATWACQAPAPRLAARRVRGCHSVINRLRTNSRPSPQPPNTNGQNPETILELGRIDLQRGIGLRRCAGLRSWDGGRSRIKPHSGRNRRPPSSGSGNTAAKAPGASRFQFLATGMSSRAQQSWPRQRRPIAVLRLGHPLHQSGPAQHRGRCGAFVG